MRLLDARALFFLVFNLFCAVSAEVSDLRLVQILFRHGDRSPTHTYPKDPYQEDAWPQGFGQLTKMGMEQLYEVGQFIRKRYITPGYFSSSYKQSEIYVESSDIDRTLMSAYSLLAGLYPPEGEEALNKQITWQPIPVHTVPLTEDLLLHIKCPSYDKLFDEMMKTPPILKIQEKYQTLIDYVAEHSGYKRTLFDLLEMTDPLLCEKIHKKEYPAWLKANNTAEKILKLSNLKAQLRSRTPELARIRGGPLLGRMLQNMRDSVNYHNTTRKAFLFSSHDTTINAFLSTLKIFNGLKLPYAASVYVELRIAAGVPSIEIFYRNDTEVDPYLLQIPDCDPCTLDKLMTLTKDMIPENPKATCEGTSHQPGRNTSNATVAVAVLTTLLVIIFIVLVAFVKLRERKQKILYRYRPVNEHL